MPPWRRYLIRQLNSFKIAPGLVCVRIILIQSSNSVRVGHCFSSFSGWRYHFREGEGEGGNDIACKLQGSMERSTIVRLKH